MTAQRSNERRGEEKAPEKRPPKDHQDHHATTPDSATSLEKERLDDDAVEKAVTVDPSAATPKSVLPSPPIPPNEQRKVREGMVTEDDDDDRAEEGSAARKRPRKGSG